MHIKALSILVFSGLIAGAAISSADAQPRRMPAPQGPAILYPEAADNGQTAIDLQSGYDSYDQGNHTHSGHEGHGGGHGGRR